MSDPIISVRNLSIHYGGAEAPASVENVSFAVGSGEIIALVGESGSGKSSLSLAIMALLAPGTFVKGRIDFEGKDLAALSRREMEDIRGGRIGMIFQEPMTCLNPVLPISRQMTEGLIRHRNMTKSEAVQLALRSLADVGIPDPVRTMASYPHELSGGMRQRVMIAAALALDPALLIADEPTTALDVTVQAQVLELLVDIRNRTGKGIIFISHDIGAVAEIADRVIVMKDGRIVEEGPWDAVLNAPQAPYTQRLIGAHSALEKALDPATHNG